MKVHLTPGQMSRILALGYDPCCGLGRIAWLIAEVERLRAELARRGAA